MILSQVDHVNWIQLAQEHGHDLLLAVLNLWVLYQRICLDFLSFNTPPPEKYQMEFLIFLDDV
jgi:hypothetical protein